MLYLTRCKRSSENGTEQNPSSHIFGVGNWHCYLSVQSERWLCLVCKRGRERKERKRVLQCERVLVRACASEWMYMSACVSLFHSCQLRMWVQAQKWWAALSLCSRAAQETYKSQHKYWGRSVTCTFISHVQTSTHIYIYFTQKLHEAFNFNKNHDVIIIVIVVVISKLNFPSDDCRQYMLVTISAGNKLCCNKSPVSCTYLHQDNGGKRMGTVFSAISSLYALLKGEGHTVTVWDSLVAQLIGLAVRS